MTEVQSQSAALASLYNWLWQEDTIVVVSHCMPLIGQFCSSFWKGRFELLPLLIQRKTFFTVSNTGKNEEIMAHKKH